MTVQWEVWREIVICIGMKLISDYYQPKGLNVNRIFIDRQNDNTSLLFFYTFHTSHNNYSEILCHCIDFYTYFVKWQQFMFKSWLANWERVNVELPRGEKVVHMCKIYKIYYKVFTIKGAKSIKLFWKYYFTIYTIKWRGCS